MQRHMTRWMRLAGVLVAAAVLAACGGGGGGSSTSGDVRPAVRGAAQATGLDRFLLYPNPVVRSDGQFEVGIKAYADAYYEAIDPTNAKDTLAKWKAANNIGVTTGGHVEYAVIIGDQRIGRIILHAKALTLIDSADDLQEDLLFQSELGVLPLAVLVMILHAQNHAMGTRNGEEASDRVDHPFDALLTANPRVALP